MQPPGKNYETGDGLSILVVVAHPDDEVLGVGGAIARYCRGGEKVHILIVADGETSRSGRSTGAVEKRIHAAAAAAKILGAQVPQMLGFADQRLDTVTLLEIVRQIETIVRETSPYIVYTHHPSDLNNDHRIVAMATLTACRPLGDTPVRNIYAFETPSSTEWSPPGPMNFVPRRFVDISATLRIKLDALRCYSDEMRPFPHPRSNKAIEALAHWRGATAGFAAAEAFDVLRELES